MRIISIITAVVVIFALYVLVFERESFDKLANGNSIKSVVEARLERQNTSAEIEISDQEVTQQIENVSELVSVVVYASSSQTLGSYVILRGETEAARFVEVRSETFGQVVSEPLRKGSFVKKNGYFV